MPKSKPDIKILHLDIETAPNTVYCWSLFPNRINTSDVIEAGYTLCWAASWEGEREVYYARRHPNDNGDLMLRKIYDMLEEADAVVHYNGTKFDIPILQREFVVRGWHPPSHFHEIDLIKTVRKRFRFASNKLDFVCQQLGLGNKTHHKGMGLWHDVMANEDKAWKIMERYNKQDVRLLKRLYKHLLPWITQHPNVGMWIMDPKKPTCTHCGSTNLQKKGRQHNTKTQSYDRYKCNTCGTPLRARLSSGKTSENVIVRTP